MKILLNDLNKVSGRIVYGFIVTILLIVWYKIMLPYLAAYAGDFVYTLILLITPAVLYITLRKLLVNHWKYRLPFIPVLITVMIATILAGIGIGIVDYIVLLNRLTLFGEIPEEPFDMSLWLFLQGYLTWYFWMGIVTTPVLYGVLWLQLRRKRVTG